MTAYVRPSYTELKARIETDLAAMPAVLRTPLSASLARGDHGLHAHLDWIDAQCSPLTCELERLYDWAALYKVDRLAATAATGTALAAGAVGTPLLVDTMLRGTNGLNYTVQSATTLGAGSTSVPIRCTTAGRAGNLIAGQTLTLIDPVSGINSTLTVGEAGISGGEEIEDVDDWRARVAEEWQTVTTYGARSGKPADYRYWARSAHPSVTTALVQLHALGIGTVLVRPICNGLADRLPTQAVLDAVAAYFKSIVPAVADWRLAAPIPNRVTISIDLVAGVDTAANRSAIESAASALVLSESSEDSVLAMAEIDAATATVTDQYTRLAPTADIAVGAGEVLVLNPLVWA